MALRGVLRAVLLGALAVASLSAAVQAAKKDPSSELTYEEILKQAESISSWIIAKRRTLHEWPEPGFQENNISSIIMKTLEAEKVGFRCVAHAPGWNAYACVSVRKLLST